MRKYDSILVNNTEIWSCEKKYSIDEWREILSKNRVVAVNIKPIVNQTLSDLKPN
jgi:hypothetical protein